MVSVHIAELCTFSSEEQLPWISERIVEEKKKDWILSIYVALTALNPKP